MILTVMLNLHFDGSLLFCGFLPESKDNSIEVDLENRQYHVFLFLSDRKNQLSDLDIDNIPTEPEQLKKQMTLHCNSLSIEINVLDIDPEILLNLEAGQSSEKTVLLKQEIYKIALNIHGHVIDYFRNVKKQHWLEPLALDPRNFQSFLDESGIVWLDSNSKWRGFPRETNQSIYFNVYMPDKNQGVSEEDWRQFAKLITKKKPANMRDVLIANSFKHIAQNNGRLAVVEAVIALETALKQLLPKAILGIPGAPQIEANSIDKVLEKAGLKAVTEVVLKLLMVPIGINENDLQTVIDAIEARNPVIHNAQRTIAIDKARNYVKTIQKVIETIEYWSAKKAT